jgi:hypothetical protein
MKEIKWKKTVGVALLYAVCTMVIRNIEAMLTMDFYKMPQYFGVWSKFMMPTAGPPPPGFFVVSLIFTFTSGLSIAMVYYYLKQYLPQKMKERIFLFADLLIATSFIFFTLPSFLLFNLPYQLLISWFISSFVILTAYSAILVKII